MNDLLQKAGFHHYTIWRHQAEFQRLKSLLLEQEQEKFLDKMVEFTLKLKQKEEKA